MHKSFYVKQTIRFRRWSRKRYAAFGSLGRVVTIGCVKKGIVDASLGKQLGVILSDACAWKEQGTEREEKDREGSCDPFCEMIQSLLRLQVVVEGKYTAEQNLMIFERGKGMQVS